MSANSNAAIIELLVKDSASGEIVKVSTSLGALKKAVTDAGAGFGGAGKASSDAMTKTNEVLGMSRREFGRTGREAVYALQMIGGKAGEANAALGGVVSAASQMGQAFAFGSGVGVAIVGVSLAVGALMTALDTATPQTKEFWKAVDNATAADGAAKGIQQITGATDDQAAAVIAAIKVNKEYAKSFKDIRDAGNSNNLIQQAGDNLGEYAKKLFVWNAYQTEYLRALKRGATEQEAQNAAMEAGIKQLTGFTQAQLADMKALEAQAPAILENARVAEIYKKGIIGMADETTAFGDTLTKLNETHKKTMISLANSISEATRKSGMDRTKIEADTVDKINQLNIDLSQKIIDLQTNMVQQIKDIEFSHTRALTEDYYQYAQSIEAMNRDIAKSAASAAKDRLQVEKDLKKSLAQIDTDQQGKATDIEDERQAALEEVRKKYGTLQLDKNKVYTAEELLTRKGYLEKQSQEEAAAINAAYNLKLAKLKKETDDRRKEAEQQKTDRLAEIAAREREQKEEFDYRRQQVNEQYAHTKEREDQAMQDQIARAQRTADDQIAQARRAAADQIAAANENETKQKAAIQATLSETLRSINQRKAAEVTAYNDSVAAANAAHATKMRLLADERTDTQKIADAWLIVKDNIDAATRALILQSEAFGPNSQMTGTYQPDWAGNHAAGGSFVVPGSGSGDRLFQIGLAPGERVNVTPAGQGTSVGGNITIQFLGAIYATTAREAETAGRGLGRGLTDALRAHGVAL